MKRVLGVIALMCLCAFPSFAGIPIFGTIRLANGNLMNGRVRFTLSYSAASDSYLQGSSFNIGTATPTPFPTSNISFGSFTRLTGETSATINNVETCVRSGANAGVKIAAAIAALPSAGGTVDCRDLEGAQMIAQDIFSGVTKPVYLLLGAATFTTSVSLTVPQNVTMDLADGAILSMNVSRTFTANATSITGTRNQHFSGSGTFAIGGIVYPEWFGAKCNSAAYDDTAGIQAGITAVGSSGTGGTVVFPAGQTCTVATIGYFPHMIKVSYDNLILDLNGGTIYTNTTPSDGLAIFGNDPTIPTYVSATTYNMSAVVKGTRTVTLTTAAQAGNFTVGDAIYLVGGTVAAGTIPNSEVNEVISANASTGVITLKWPTAKAYSNDGVNAYGAANVESRTRRNLTIKNGFINTQVTGVSVNQTIGLTLQNIDFDLSRGPSPNTSPLSSGDMRQVVWDDVNAYLSDSSGSGIYQVARNSISVQIKNSFFECGAVSCQPINVSEGSADVEITGNRITGVGQFIGSEFDDLNIHHNYISINSGTAAPQLNFANAGTSNPVSITNNIINCPGTSTTYCLVASGINSIVGGNRIASLGSTAILVAGTAIGMVVSGNAIATDDDCILVSSTNHAVVISGNTCYGDGSGTAFAVADNGAQNMSVTIVDNKGWDFTTGINITDPVDDAGYITSGNDFYSTTTPYNPTVANLHTPTLLWNTYTPNLTNVTNLDGSKAYALNYYRVGNVMTISGKVDVKPTAAAPTETELGISVPIDSDFTVDQDCGGAAYASAVASEGAALFADATNNRIKMVWRTVSTNDHSMAFSVTCIIK